ncbi:MAG: hypothetical protein II453_15900 [Alphaproteobacteria bacterium]|nr:hypothetical protein [Alphaproteobacteria bacterium]
MMKVIETIINTPKALASNDSAIVYDGVSTLGRCTPCCNGGWLSYQNGSPLFKILDRNYTGRYEANFSATISSATAGSVAIGLYEDGVLIPDTVRAVTLASADDYATVSFNKLLKLCPYTTTTLTVRSVPALTVPSDPTATPIETEIPIIYSATFNLKKENR